MSDFDKESLQHLKRLSRLDCTPAEEADILQSLKRVLDYVEQLGEIDTDGIAPCNFVLRSMAKELLREDQVERLMPRDQFLANASDTIAGMIRVPPILKS